MKPSQMYRSDFLRKFDIRIERLRAGYAFVYRGADRVAPSCSWGTLEKVGNKWMFQRRKRKYERISPTYGITQCDAIAAFIEKEAP